MLQSFDLNSSGHGEEGPRPRAVMVAIQQPGVSDDELDSSLMELKRLATTLGLEVIGRITQKRAGLNSGKVLGDGKLLELARWTGGSGLVPKFERPGRKRDDETADEDDPDDEVGSGVVPDALPPEERATVVLVDHDLSPRQQRNLEKATGAEVHDRTSVILGIFHRHARTREARLQVEIARLAYLAPRLRESGGGGDRVRGGIGGRGAGESALELDRRRIRDRIAELRREIASIEGGSRTRRGRRSELPTVALVGYTNAGKSSLMRALTGSEVYVADKLFATLDTTVRVLVPRTEPPILVSDTVGFIKKLPHDLVASFRSTLEEAAEADLLLHVLDASDPAFRDHLKVTREVLADLEADRAPTWLLLNKIDNVSKALCEMLLAELPGAIALSAHDPADVDALRQRIVGHFLGGQEDAELFVPWAQHRVVHAIHEQCQVLAETHEDAGTRLAVRAPREVLNRLRGELA